MLWQHHHLPSVPSTNRWALEWLRQTLPQGPVLFTADHQTEGRGQRDRRWSSESKRDVCLSLALPVESHWHPAILNMHVALSVREALMRHLPSSQSAQSIQIKWPNDILVWHAGMHRKVSGILVENVWRGSQWSVAVVGVGINAQSSRLTRSYPAVSLSEAWNKDLVPADLAMDVCRELTKPLRPAAEIMADYHRVLFGLKEARNFVVHERSWKGTFLGVNEEGLGGFDWEPQSGVDLSPSAWLASSEVQWCW